MNATPTITEILQRHYQQKEAEMLKTHKSQSRKRTRLIFEMQELQRKIKAGTNTDFLKGINH